ncbi:unnamed protein product [Lathyrus sativus]|nr:unnamed protein product [Lathyrus sativus]
MNVITFNICGSGNSVKRRRFNHIMLKGATDLCLIQESKCKSMDDKLVHSLLGSDGSAYNAIGQSGGILTMWRKNYFVPIFSFRGVGYLGMFVSCRGMSCYIVNV